MSQEAPNLAPDQVEQRARKAVLTAVRTLLEEKHLYQRVFVDVTVMELQIGQPPVTSAAQLILMRGVPTISGEELSRAKLLAAKIRDLQTALVNIVDAEWDFKVEGAKTPMGGQVRNRVPVFELPTIKIPCANKGCDSVLPPHNSGYGSLDVLMPPLCLRRQQSFYVGPTVQLFEIPYQCQACKGEPLVFLVRREGRKLQMVGRSHFPTVQVPTFLPVEESDYFKQARTAFDTGNVLPALFMLRTFVEQYLRRVLERNDRAGGDELGAHYAKRLDGAFSSSAPSLSKIYEELSEKLRTPEADSEQFLKSSKEIEHHFDVLRLFPLKPPSCIQVSTEADLSKTDE